MSDTLTPYVFDATRDNFEALVVQNSRRGLVLAHFWSPKAGPCLVLMPRLVRLAAEYGGRFLLVMVNTDELGHQARALGVTSVPTVKFFLRGEVVHTIHGADPDAIFRAALDRYLASDQDRARQQALALHQAGDTAGAIEALARLAVEQPEDIRVVIDLAKLLTLAQRADEALGLLDSLPAAARRIREIASLRVHLELLAAARMDAGTLAVGSPEARLCAAARALLEDDLPTAMTGLLDLARLAPEHRDDVGRRALIGLFDMLGNDHPLTRQYRGELAHLS